MQLYGFTPAMVQVALGIINVNNCGYAGNIRFDVTSNGRHGAGGDYGWRKRTRGAWANQWYVGGVLRANNSKAHGARRAASGRHGPWASWEAHRDFMVQLFRLNPDGRIHSCFADYRGLNHFLLTHGATGKHNIGSIIDPKTVRDVTVQPGDGKAARALAAYCEERDEELGWSKPHLVERKNVIG